MDNLELLFNTHYITIARYIFVFLCFFIFIEIKRLMLYSNEKPKLLGILTINNGHFTIPITSYEATIGRSKNCDIIINLPVISRQHAVLTMDDSGYWKITDTSSKGGTLVNGKPLTDDTLIAMGDTITLAGLNMVLTPATFMDAREFEENNKKKESSFLNKIKNIKFIGRKEGSYAYAMLLLNLFQLLAYIQFYLTMDETYLKTLTIVFLCIGLTPWIYRIVSKLLQLTNLGAEAAAFFLTTISFCVVASANPQDLIKQLAAYYLGLIFYSVLCVILKNLSMIMKLRRYVAILSIILLMINLVFGKNLNGQTNWIVVGGLSIQPSEIVKVLFVFSSSATLNWLFDNKNLRNLIVYSVGCVGLLILMGDFGTAIIFFATFIILMFMTSGDIKAIFITLLTAGLGGLMILNFKPYITQRFSTWRHVFEHIYDAGSQQARALIAMSSGGLLGLGACNGFARNLYAGDSDIVISIITEEWGLIIAVLVAAIYIVFMLSAIRSHKVARSSYYVIAAVSAASLLLIQASLNIFGAVDVLPFTGVTLAFVSNGGSSMIGSFGLLSFITAGLNYAKPKKNKAATVVNLQEDVIDE